VLVLAQLHIMAWLLHYVEMPAVIDGYVTLQHPRAISLAGPAWAPFRRVVARAGGAVAIPRWLFGPGPAPATTPPVRPPPSAAPAAPPAAVPPTVPAPAHPPPPPAAPVQPVSPPAVAPTARPRPEPVVRVQVRPGAVGGSERPPLGPVTFAATVRPARPAGMPGWLFVSGQPQWRPRGNSPHLQLMQPVMVAIETPPGVRAVIWRPVPTFGPVSPVHQGGGVRPAGVGGRPPPAPGSGAPALRPAAPAS